MQNNNEVTVEKTPHELAQERINISRRYSEIGKRMADLKIIKSVWWKGFRPDFKSDASADRAFDLTDEGVEMIKISMEMKGLEMEMSAIKTMLSVLNDEAHNMY